METAVGVNMVAEPESTGSAAFPVSASGGVSQDLPDAVARAAEALNYVRRHGMQTAARMSPGQAAALAADVEAMSRTVDYLQIVCAGALETHRVVEAFGAAGAPTAPSAETQGPWTTTWAQSDRAGSEPSDDSAAERAAGKVRTEFRSTADYMRVRLRIGRGEAQRRLKLAASILPTSNISGQPVPADLPALAEAVSEGLISSAAAAVVVTAVEEIRPRTDAAAASAIETDLTTLAAHHDADFLNRTARRWVLVVNQDGSEPTEEELRRFQGIFPGRRKNGLNHLSIYCTDDQHETLLTVMNAAAGPRVTDAAIPSNSHRDGDLSQTASRETAVGQKLAAGQGPGASGPTAVKASAGKGAAAGGTSAVKASAGQETAGNRDTAIRGGATNGSGAPPDPATASRLDRRTRPQRLLAGLVDAAKAALASGGVPAAGGLRPQVLVTIDSASLLQAFNFGSVLKPMDSAESEPLTAALPGSFAFSGPVAAATVRKLACDADLLPVVLSGEGRILDIGRSQRLFPPHLRKALHARDGGCAFPGCTIPGPWTEAHHIRYWNRGGRTSAENGVLLCSHHHHEVHKENWRIEVESGVPWFVPPAYVDPDRVPLRNMYFRTTAGSGYLPAPPDALQVS